MKNYVYSAFDQIIDDIHDLKDYEDAFRFVVRLYLNEELTFKEFLDFGNYLLDCRFDILVSIEESKYGKELCHE